MSIKHVTPGEELEIKMCNDKVCYVSYMGTTILDKSTRCPGRIMAELGCAKLNVHVSSIERSVDFDPSDEGISQSKVTENMVLDTVKLVKHLAQHQLVKCGCESAQCASCCEIMYLLKEVERGS